MSRPSMSVPNQYAADGSRVRRCVASVVGSTVHRYGASNAISSMSATSAPPMAIAGCRRTKPQTGPCAFGAGRMSGSSGATAMPSGAGRGEDRRVQ